MRVKQGSSGAGEGFEVTKFGHGRVALIGFPRLAVSLFLCFVTGHEGFNSHQEKQFLKHFIYS